MKSLLLAMFLFSLSACVSSIMQKTTNNYMNSVSALQQSGEWQKAVEPARRAVINAESPSTNATPLQKAIAHYEYGRTLGATCAFQEAEKELKKAHDLDKEAKQPLYLSLVELARLNLDQGRHVEANRYFQSAIKEIKLARVDEHAPRAFSDILNEYSQSLEKTGKIKEAKVAKKQAENLVASSSTGSSMTDRTPYGKFCPKK